MLIVLAILTLVTLTGLWVGFCIKMSQWISIEEQDPPKRTGRSIDVANLKPRVEDARRDYLAARGSPRGQFFHTALLRRARQVVTHFAYFRRQAREEDLDARGL